MPITPDIVPDGVEALKAALVAERQARQEAEARATGAEAMVAHLKLVIAKLRRERFGPSAERGAKLLDQLELQLEELEASATEDELAAQGKSAEEGTIVTSFTRKKPVRAPFPEHLSRERVVIPAPAACPCCGGKLAKLGEDVTETLEVVPRQWKVVQTVREKFTCRSCEKITQPPAPLPHHAPLAAWLLYETVDAIWYAAGDIATDFSFYTKRLMLSGLYSAAVLYSCIGSKTAPRALPRRAVSSTAGLPRWRGWTAYAATSTPSLSGCPTRCGCCVPCADPLARDDWAGSTAGPRHQTSREMQIAISNEH